MVKWIFPKLHDSLLSSVRLKNSFLKHSLEITGLCLLKCSKNCHTFRNKKMQVCSVFFSLLATLFSLLIIALIFGHRKVWQILERFSGTCHQAYYSYFWRVIIADITYLHVCTYNNCGFDGNVHLYVEGSGRA